MCRERERLSRKTDYEKGKEAKKERVGEERRLYGLKGGGTGAQGERRNRNTRGKEARRTEEEEHFENEDTGTQRRGWSKYIRRSNTNI